MKTPLLLSACLLALAGCDYAPANVKTLQTTDCGVSWRAIPAGQRVPSTKMDPCAYNTVLPDYPMQGDTEFLTQFQGNILVKVKIGYDYEIVDPVKYLGFAKFLGKISSTAAQASSSTAMASYETAENVVIDVVLREQVTGSTLKFDIVTFNPSSYEDQLFLLANKTLAERGVALRNMSFVTVVEDQTRMAIDAATAMAVYRSKGMEQLGQQLVIARAGATSVVVNSATKGQ